MKWGWLPAGNSIRTLELIRCQLRGRPSRNPAPRLVLASSGQAPFPIPSASERGARASADGNPPGPLFRRTRPLATFRSELQPNAVAMLPRRRVIRFWNGIADNLPAEKITGLAKCSCAGIAEEHQIFRLQYDNVIFFVAPDRYLSPRRANKTLNHY
jgi:hypothetical protein